MFPNTLTFEVSCFNKLEELSLYYYHHHLNELHNAKCVFFFLCSLVYFMLIAFNLSTPFLPSMHAYISAFCVSDSLQRVSLGESLRKNILREAACQDFIAVMWCICQMVLNFQAGNSSIFSCSRQR